MARHLVFSTQFLCRQESRRTERGAYKMTVGISVPLPAYTFDPAIITKKAEDLGFDSIWYAEHPAVPVESVSPFPATGGEIPWTYNHQHYSYFRSEYLLFYSCSLPNNYQ